MNAEAAPCQGYDPVPRAIDMKLPDGACDTHVHIFGPLDVYPYQKARSYTPPEAPESAYRHLLRLYGFWRAVYIQPSVYGTDNSRMLALFENASGDEIQWRGVAVLDESVTDTRLEYMHEVGVRGIRLNLLFSGGVDFETIERMATRISPLGWHVQFLLDVSVFSRLSKWLSRLPVPSVIDHMGHLPVAKGVDNPGFQDLLALVREGRTWVKLSAPYRLTAFRLPPYTDVDPFAQALIEANPDQLLFGTDWPHPGISVPMPNDGDLMQEFLRWMQGDGKLTRRILVANPERLYGF